MWICEALARTWSAAVAPTAASVTQLYLSSAKAISAARGLADSSHAEVHAAPPV